MRVSICVFALLATVLASSRPSPRIIGGVDASLGEFPWQVSYQWGADNVWQHSCGGSILNATTIISAGHCVTELPTFGDFRIIAGILDLNNQSNAQIIKVVRKIVHPDYINAVGPNDISLLILENELEFNELVQPVKLPENGNVTGNVTLSGWGAVSDIIFPLMPNRLQKAELPIIEAEDCKKALDKISKSDPFDADSNICTGPLTGGYSICVGDIGGPLVQNGILYGVASWGITPCGGMGEPSVYTQVSNFIDFIQYGQ